MLNIPYNVWNKWDPIKEVIVGSCVNVNFFAHVKNIYELFHKGDTTPVHMTLGFTNYCQHKCPWCYINWQQAGRNSLRSGNGTKERKAINADDRYIEAVKEARDLGLKAVTIVGDGEPTMHKKFVQHTDRIKSFGLDLLSSNSSFFASSYLLAHNNLIAFSYFFFNWSSVNGSF